MSLPRIQTVSLTTDGSGDSTDFSTSIRGRVLSIQYVKTDFANGVTFTITGETTAVSIWSEAAVNASVFQLPTQPANTQTGGTVSNGFRDIFLAGERIQIVVASGGGTNTGAFRIITD